MAESNSKEYQSGSPLAHTEMCKFHDFPIDMICEDCDEFICTKCAKTDHRDHDWSTISTAATQRRRGLLEFLRKIKKEDLSGIDEKIEKVSKQITDNIELCDSEIEKVQKHFDEIMARLIEIKKRHEKTLRDKLVKKNDQLNNVKSELKNKKRGIVDAVEFIEENNNTMSDLGLLDNQKELIKLLSELEVHATKCEHSVRYIRGEINDDLLESMVGRTLDLDDIDVIQRNSFKYGANLIYMLETFSEDQCYIKDKSEYTGKVNKQGAKKHKFRITPNDVCVTNGNDIYFSDSTNNSISCLSPSGSVSPVISTDPLEPGGICQSVNGGLLVTLRDNEFDDYKLDSHSRRLVRHITVTGDVIHEYEYQEDGQTRLFTLPTRITQNSNSDICVVNFKSDITGDLMIMSSSGRMKSVYRGQNLTKNFSPTDVVCDSLCNILVTDPSDKQIHLLSPDGEFLKFLLTDNEVNFPFSLSLYKCTLWVGYYEGLVRVFQYKM